MQLFDLVLIAFQSTPSAWRETLFHVLQVPDASISIHSLRMEGDQRGSENGRTRRKFQSTPSAWRETDM